MLLQGEMGGGDYIIHKPRRVRDGNNMWKRKCEETRMPDINTVWIHLHSYNETTNESVSCHPSDVWGLGTRIK